MSTTLAAPLARGFLMAGAAVVAVPTPSVAHLGNFVVPIYELPTSEVPDVGDGTLADWEAVVPGASMDHTVAYVGRGEVNPEDLAWRGFLAWHWTSQRLYVGIERLDDVYEEEGLITGDRIEFYVDGDHSGGMWRDTYRASASNAQGYEVVTGPHNRTGSTEFLLSALFQWPAQSPWADFGYSVVGEAPSQTVLEFAVTVWDSISSKGAESSRQSTLRPNGIIGLQLVMTDEDGGLDIQIQYLVQPKCKGCEIPVFYAETFADGQLIPCDVGDCSGEAYEPTSVAADSWGRIKASFR